MNRETTVLEFFPALEAGYEPKNYSYYKEDVPLGSYKAKLDFMLWSKTYMAVNCFFTIIKSQKKISLSVYKKPGEDGLFLAGELEVRYVPFGSTLQLVIDANQNGKPILFDAFVEGNVTGD
ncbi:hypothetical protein SAMN05421820_101433 [Pedobacter steynii]|uniref:Uncharacterized protein n=1 Tax=Pedobacter steynii TaxID=430522 RepID=A0A1G9K1Y3_9SPHI|nr:hypothetical protein [Pedobacter steynii]NQX38413.1 hypothetical protein [Pedobacter steynii]SDL43414.1 hypothetical protein SAMN05421820_101433 [Pedobacter steynii]